MGEWFDGLPELQKMFVAATLLGGALFVVRIVLGLFAGADDLADGDDIGTGSDGALASFRILSYQGISSFAMMFGLVGLALARQQGASAPVAIGGGFAAGALTVWVIGRVFIGIGKLESDGTIKLARAIGVVGTVDLTIPPQGVGKARVIVQQRLRVYDAVSSADFPLATGDRVRVTEIIEGNILVVEPYPASAKEAREAK